MSTDVEKRLAAALEARAAQVGPHDLADRPLPAPSRRRPGVAVLAAAACLAAVAGGVAVAGLGGEEAPTPAPAPEDPEVVLPPDVGRDWPRADGASRLDLDGDGAAETVRLRGEPSPEADGRLRLEARLSGGGTAYGVVDLGTTLYSYAFDPVDADGDGDEELVLASDDPDAMSTTPRVLDLRDGVLVEAPPAETDDARLGGGALGVDGAGTDDYTVERVLDWWVEDGVLRSSTSAAGFPALGTSWFVPDPYVAESWTWRLADDGVLRPEAADRICVSRLDEERVPCAPGETDALPDRSPVVAQTVGAGESFELDGVVSGTVSVEDTPDGPILTVGGARPFSASLPGDDPRVFTTPATGLFADGLSLVVDRDGDGEPDTHLRAVPGSRGTTEVEFAEAPDTSADAQRWLTGQGEVFTVEGSRSRAELTQWALDGDRLLAVPLGEVCDLGASPDTGERC